MRSTTTSHFNRTMLALGNATIHDDLIPMKGVIVRQLLCSHMSYTHAHGIDTP